MASGSIQTSSQDHGTRHYGTDAGDEVTFDVVFGPHLISSSILCTFSKLNHLNRSPARLTRNMRGMSHRIQPSRLGRKIERKDSGAVHGRFKIDHGCRLPIKALEQ